jgi:hypothetical protein
LIDLPVDDVISIQAPGSRASAEAVNVSSSSRSRWSRAEETARGSVHIRRHFFAVTAKRVGRVWTAISQA